MLVRNRGQVPMVILRPAIITGAAAEPQPGYVLSNRELVACLAYRVLLRDQHHSSVPG